MLRRCFGFWLCLVAPLTAVSTDADCSQLSTCGECVGEGCGWCSWCPYCSGQCLGYAGGTFTCSEIYTNIPGSLCRDGSNDTRPSSVQYDCNPVSGKCETIPPFVSPQYQSLSSCINACRPANASGPFHVCNASTGQCSQTASNETGTTQDLCDSQCLDQTTCNGGVCTNAGVDGLNAPTCPVDGCPQPRPGPNCSALSSVGCSACLAEAGYCGWCPSNNTCAPIGKNVEQYLCGPGFTTEPSTCQNIVLG